MLLQRWIVATSLVVFTTTFSLSQDALVQPRQSDGDGSVAVSGDLLVWHKVTLTQQGPYAHEKDRTPNPFVHREMVVTFRHSKSGTEYVVPGYFAADGNAGETSAESGTAWRAHLAPDRVGAWTYRVEFYGGGTIVSDRFAKRAPLAPYHGKTGSFEVKASDKSGRDLRGKGRLQYVGQRYLQFAGTKEWFLKAGADAPETLLGYKDFDGTVARKKKVPLKTYAAHVKDWKPGDPQWKGGRGKGLIGAISYLSGKGCNAFSFLTYNAGGDGDNVWPFVSRNAKLHYDCSKLDQWGAVFDHGTAKGMYLHFKLQETEIDDHRKKGTDRVPECLDGGLLGEERKLYCREIVARFGHNLALNWNLGEENTQTTNEQISMANFLRRMDAYGHLIVVHTYPNQQDKVYRPLLGGRSVLRGFSLQNSHIKDTHHQTVKWVSESHASGTPWVVAFDESGSAAHGQCPDLGYRGFDGRDSAGKKIYTEHQVRKQTLWGTLMGGGAGVEYYFGYKFVENDLVCEDWRSRDRSWDACRHALEFFRNAQRSIGVPLYELIPADELVGNPKRDNSRYCLAKRGRAYIVYLPDGGTTKLNLRGEPGSYRVRSFNPRTGGALQVTGKVSGGSDVTIGEAGEREDVVYLVEKTP
ncbi:MAG: DUF5060 domain-containing protein [Planctomycetota bacterium]